MLLTQRGARLRLAISAILALALPGMALAGSGPAMVVVAGDGTVGFEDGHAARFNKPIRLAPYGEDAVLVADIFNHAIRVVRRDGSVTTLAGGPEKKGHRDGPAEQAQFASPHGVAVSPTGVIAVAEAENHTIRLMTPVEGTFMVSTLAGVPEQDGMRDGPAEQALFNSPHAVMWTEAGDLLVADIGNARLRLIKDGRVISVAGTGESGSADGPSDQATFHYPMDIAAAPDGSVVIADAGSHLVRRWSPADGVTTLPIDGEIKTPHGIAAGSDGIVYLAEMNRHAVTALAPDGSLERVCGTGQAGSGPEELNRPAAVLVHGDSLWVADLDNHRINVCPLLRSAPALP